MCTFGFGSGDGYGAIAFDWQMEVNRLFVQWVCSIGF
jgi:hypothetical protein